MRWLIPEYFLLLHEHGHAHIFIFQALLLFISSGVNRSFQAEEVEASQPASWGEDLSGPIGCAGGERPTEPGPLKKSL